MAWIASSAWRPIGVDDLEPAAWDALRSTRSVCVTAGPGAGKTEFLAQRAAYLLQTGLCRPPFHILAISFKKDAAHNLASRVAARCTAAQASRFESLTFDAFTKGLADRFMKTIPSAWRPGADYEIVFPKRSDYVDFLDRVLRAAPPAWQSEIATLKADDFEPKDIGTWRMKEEREPPRTPMEFVRQAWWDEHQESGNTITFTLINRLAELVVRSNRRILGALRRTYPFVFLDEFQDTTYAQYDFLMTAFAESPATLTAVGDAKQRIMIWAGARPDAFERLAADAGATDVTLTMNYRSSRDLVKIQHVVARAIDGAVAPVTSNRPKTISDDVAQIWRFRFPREEAAYIASWLADDSVSRALDPRDYALLVKQKADQYERQLSGSFRGAGIGLRNEAKKVGKTSLQDLLAEDLVRVASGLLRLAVQARSPASWRFATETLLRLRDTADDEMRAAAQIAEELSRFVAKLKLALSRTSPSEESANQIAGFILDFLVVDAFRRTYREYSVGDSLEIARDAYIEHIKTCAGVENTWQDVVDAFDGTEQVPLMTVHKSKGLEYDTIIFVGLDDDAWWSHSPGNIEGLSTFFVALSRAKQRAIFTYCEGRGRDRVRDLYDLLRSAGVTEQRFNT